MQRWPSQWTAANSLHGKKNRSLACCNTQYNYLPQANSNWMAEPAGYRW